MRQEPSGLASTWNFRLHQQRKLRQRLLPAQMTGLGRNDIGDTRLLDMQLGAAIDFLESDRHRHHTRQVGIIESVRVADARMRHQFQIFTAEAVAVAAAEMGEGHAECAADPRLEVMHRAGEAIRRQPFGQAVSIGEGLVEAFGWGAEDAVKFDGVGYVKYILQIKKLLRPYLLPRKQKFILRSIRPTIH